MKKNRMGLDLDPESPCKCGSGTAYRNCCGQNQMSESERLEHAKKNATGLLLDAQSKNVYVVSKEILVNQYRRDSIFIEKSFDNLCDDDLRMISALYSRSIGILMLSLKMAYREKNEERQLCTTLMINASQTICAALSLVRSGYSLQPGILVRNILETISAVLHLIQNPADHDKFLAGELASTRTLKAAKAAIPIFGHAYGFFTEHYSHIGVPHMQVKDIGPYREKDIPLQSNLIFLKFVTWLHYVSVELVCLFLVDEPKYWTYVDPGEFHYSPSERGKEWIRQFVDIGLEETEIQATSSVTSSKVPHG